MGTKRRRERTQYDETTRATSTKTEKQATRSGRRVRVSAPSTAALWAVSASKTASASTCMEKPGRRREKSCVWRSMRINRVRSSPDRTRAAGQTHGTQGWNVPLLQSVCPDAHRASSGTSQIAEGERHAPPVILRSVIGEEDTQGKEPITEHDPFDPQRPK